MNTRALTFFFFFIISLRIIFVEQTNESVSPHYNAIVLSLPFFVFLHQRGDEFKAPKLELDIILN